MHGTGVRRASFDTTLRLVQDGVARDAPGVAAAPCYWGEPHGAQLSSAGASIPQTAATRGPDREADLWVLLELDPLYELRLLSGSPGVRVPEQPADRVPSGRRLRDAALGLPADPVVDAAVRAAGLADVFAGAVVAVLGAPEAVTALASAAPPDVLGAALANAVTAQALSRADEQSQGLFPVTGQQRDLVVARILEALAVDGRGVGALLARSGLRLAEVIGAVGWVERRRALMTSAASPASGDVMLYLARGRAIREHIAATVRQVNDDVVLLAHSLGGIACVDLLIADVPANLRGLITVGSQAGFLHELGALPGLPPGAALPDTFPVPWINVFDPRDFLAFLAEPIFGDRVRDVRVDNQVPFPRSHSAYFANPQLYAVVASVCAAVSR
ncbi:hypothetical protein AB0M47_04990 [Hamadaea sp. NPDC051192]|uniref:hypothetical protein n=1 Tax=Hamadaea sp. NPDC051192 TaxID=3154940 RepID=UPI0034404B05